MINIAKFWKDSELKKAIEEMPFIALTDELKNKYIGIDVDLGEGDKGTITKLISNKETGGVVAAEVRINKNHKYYYTIIPLSFMAKQDGLIA